MHTYIYACVHIHTRMHSHTCTEVLPNLPNKKVVTPGCHYKVEFFVEKVRLQPSKQCESFLCEELVDFFSAIYNF